jgi:hypothetical protein
VLNVNLTADRKLKVQDVPVIGMLKGKLYLQVCLFFRHPVAVLKGKLSVSFPDCYLL